MSIHGNRKYQWESWFDHPITVLKRGEHYHCSQSTMVGMIRNAASNRKLRVKITDYDSSIVITIMTCTWLDKKHLERLNNETTHPNTSTIAR